MTEKLLSKKDAAFGLVIAAGFGAHFTGLIDFPWWIDWTVGLWFYTSWGFFALVHAGGMLKRNVGTWWAKHLAPLLVLFIPADALFNVVFGSWIFKEKPQWPDEWLFSNRVERHYRRRFTPRAGSTPQQIAAAIAWADRLNAVDPDHIHD